MERAAEDKKLAAFLSDLLNVKVTRRELEAPASDLMSSVFVNIFREAGLNGTAFEMPQGMAPLHLHNCVPVMHLTRVMQVIFSKLGVQDFGLSDITDPTPRRSRKQLRLLMNFWLRLSRQWGTWANIEESLAASKADREAKKAELDAVKARINQLSQHSGNNPEKLAAAQDELADGDRTLAAMSAKRALMVSDYQGLKNAACQQTEQEKKSRVEVLELRTMVHDVRDKICRSPERQQCCMAEQEDVAFQLQEERHSLQANVDKMRKKVQLAPRQLKVLAQLESQMCSHLATSSQLHILERNKEEVFMQRRAAEDSYHRLLKERDAAAEEKGQLNARSGSVQQSMMRELALKKKQVVELEQQLEQLRLRQQEQACSEDSEMAALVAETRKFEDEYRELRQFTKEKVDETNRDIDRVFARHSASIEKVKRVFASIGSFGGAKEPAQDAAAEGAVEGRKDS